MTANPLTWNNFAMVVEPNPAQYGKNQYPFEAVVQPPQAAPSPFVAGALEAEMATAVAPQVQAVLQTARVQQTDVRTEVVFSGEIQVTVVLDGPNSQAFLRAGPLGTDIRSKVTHVFLVDDENPDNRELRCICQLDDWQGDPELKVDLVLAFQGTTYAPGTVTARASHSSTYDIFVKTGRAITVGDVVDVTVTATLTHP